MFLLFPSIFHGKSKFLATSCASCFTNISGGPCTPATKSRDHEFRRLGISPKGWWIVRESTTPKCPYIQLLGLIPLKNYRGNGKFSMSNRRNIFKWLFFHWHFSFLGCIGIWPNKTTRDTMIFIRIPVLRTSIIIERHVTWVLQKLNWRFHQLSVYVDEITHS